MRRAFQIEEFIYSEVFEHIIHDYKVKPLSDQVLISEVDLVQAEKATDKTVRIALHVMEVVFQHRSELVKLSLWNSLKHVLLVFSVVK